MSSIPAPSLVRLVDGGVDDLDQLMAVMHAAFGTGFGEAWTRSQCAGILTMAGVSLIIARDGRDTPVGFSLSRTVAGESELLLLAVAPGHQRRGIGRSLLGRFLGRAAAQGVARVHLEVRDGNAAIAMYSAAGFTVVGRRRDYYQGSEGKRFDALTLALTT